MTVAKRSPTPGDRKRGEGIEAGNLTTKYTTGKALLRRTPRRGAIRLHPVEPMHLEDPRASEFDPIYIGFGLYAIWDRVPGEAGGASDA